MDSHEAHNRNTVELRSYFVRERNALLVRAQFAPLYEDYFLHLLQHGLRNAPQHDELVKDLLAALTLHLGSRPRNETTAWTLNLQRPPLNLFATGDSVSGRVTGRVFTEDVSERAQSLFYSQSRESGGAPRLSTIAIPEPQIGGHRIFRAVEAYYRQSEQRPARLFRYAPEDIVMVSAQPDCDLAWLDQLDDDAIRTLDAGESLRLLETRSYFFACGCSLERILPVLAAMSAEARSRLFAENDPAVVTCPRCGAVFLLASGQLDQFMDDHC